jgi:hypothetical protein
LGVIAANMLPTNMPPTTTINSRTMNEARAAGADQQQRPRAPLKAAKRSAKRAPPSRSALRAAIIVPPTKRRHDADDEAADQREDAITQTMRANTPRCRSRRPATA